MITIKQIDSWCEDIVTRFNPDKVVLFGSCAQGNATEDSDVDLLVVMPFEGRSIEQAVKLRMGTRPSFPVDLIVRTPKMIEERLSMGDSFINDILEKGMVLYEASHA
ncbi:MAG: nucleotidyltransferase domain-containing protein [Kiritimatiellae bacterium]|jgi:predicted nucleotidyltransferase|nr:nucleotidyltransferase domain-containing protein [Kiritimatiellia bacterium]